MFNFSSGASSAPARARWMEDERKRNLNTGMTNIAKVMSKFDDAYYDRREKEYINFAMPQLGEQQRAASTGLTGSLANRGLLRSSVARESRGALANAFAGQRQGVVDEAIAQSNADRAMRVGQQGQQIQQLIASTAPNIRAQSAMTGAQNINLPADQSPQAMLNAILSAMAMAYQGKGA